MDLNFPSYFQLRINGPKTAENVVGSFTAEICCGVAGIKYYIIFHV